MDDNTNKLKSKENIDFLIRIGLIAYLIYLCIKIVSPFTVVVVWGIILAVMLYPLQQIFASKMGGREGRASIVIVVLGCCLIGLPLLSSTLSLAEHVGEVHEAFTNDKLVIPEPKESVKQWPYIGEKAYETWSVATNNLPALIKQYKKPLQVILKQVLVLGGGVLGTMGMFTFALIIAGMLMTWAESGTQIFKRILQRVVGDVKAPELQQLSVATIRSVANGVIGVAVIQALLFGVGFMFADIPASGLWVLIILVFGIIQLPSTIVALPIIIYMWMGTDNSTFMNVFFTLYFFLAGLSDNVLKPVFLGRGVNVPMLVILIGALGGMMSGGLIGLFLGPVLLATAYQIFMDWMGENNEADPASLSEVVIDDDSAPEGEA